MLGADEYRYAVGRLSAADLELEQLSVRLTVLEAEIRSDSESSTGATRAHIRDAVAALGTARAALDNAGADLPTPLRRLGVA